jgi:hypothetical protein
MVFRTYWRKLLERIIHEEGFVIPRNEESPGAAGPVMWTDALRAGILRWRSG